MLGSQSAFTKTDKIFWKKGSETWLTLPLDLEHADGVLRRQVPELAGRQRVSPLSQRADRRLQEEGLEERWVTDLMSHDDVLYQMFRSRKCWALSLSILRLFLCCVRCSKSGCAGCTLCSPSCSFVSSVSLPRVETQLTSLSSFTSCSSHTVKWSSQSARAVCTRAAKVSKSAAALKWQTKQFPGPLFSFVCNCQSQTLLLFHLLVFPYGKWMHEGMNKWQNLI